MPVSTAGILWRRSVRRAEKFSSRDDDSGADRIARTRVLVSSAPAIAGEGDRAKHGGGGAGGEGNSDASGEASMQAPRPPRKCAVPLPAIAGRDEISYAA